MKNYKQPGKVIPKILTAAVVSGAVQLIGELVGVAAKSGAIGEEVEFSLEGVYTIPKTAAQVYTQGQILYWDDTTKLITSTVGTNKVAGYAFAAAAGADASVDVLIGHK